MADLNCIKPIPCPAEVEEKEIYPPATPAFTFCAGKYTIAWDGTRLRAEATNTVPDGEYDTVTVADGCIVGYGNGVAPTYTPPYCNPNPAPCSDGSGGGTSTTISPQAGNILTSSALGLYARSYVQGSTGISVTGNGTEGNPYKVSSSIGSGVTAVTAGPHIAVDNTIPSAPSVGLSPSGITAGVYSGFNVDRFGIITGFTEVNSDGVDDILAGDDIAVSNTLGTFTISHPATAASNLTVQTGAYSMKVSKGGHVESLTRNITLDGGIYAVDGWLFTINTHGSITNIAADVVVPPPRSRAIIDIIEVLYTVAGDVYTVQGLSDEPPSAVVGNGALLSFTMPTYVKNVEQVTVIGQFAGAVEVFETVPVTVTITDETVDGALTKFVIREA